MPRDSPEYRQQNVMQNRNGQQSAQQPVHLMPRPQKENLPRDDMRRLSSYVLDEVKKIKVSLPLYELMKISEVRDTILGSLYETPTVKNTPQEAPSSSRNPPINVQSRPTQSANMVEEVSNAPFNTWETPQQSQGFVGMVQGSSSEPEKPKVEDKRRVRFNLPTEQKQEQTQRVTRDNQVPQRDEKNERKNIIPEERKKPVVFY